MENTKIQKKMKVAGWILSSLAIFFLLLDAIGKFVKPKEVIEGTLALGYAEYLIMPIGIILLICTIFLAIPRTAILGAVLTTGYLGGAVASNFRVENPLASHILFPIYLAIIIWAGLYLRSASLRAFILR